MVKARSGSFTRFRGCHQLEYDPVELLQRSAQADEESY